MEAGSAARRPGTPAGATIWAAAGVAVVLVAAAATDAAPMPALATVTAATWLLAAHRALLRWRTLAVVAILVVLFIPVGRYSLPGDLPFALEPYRLLMALLAILWFACLLVQPQTRARRTILGPPVAAVAFAVGASVAVNGVRIASQGLLTDVVRDLTFLASFLFAAVFLANVLETRRDLDAVLGWLTAGGAVVAALTLVESRTGLTPFNSLHSVIPVLHFESSGLPSYLELRGTSHRPLASAQHPIALGAALALLVPVSVYLAQRRGRRWWAATALLGLGVLATVARTATVMLVIEVLVLLCLKPRAMLRLWPWALPFLAVVHLAVPGTLGGLRDSFLPVGGLVSEQEAGKGTYGSGRLADVGPALQTLSAHPWFGEGYGTRITDRADPRHNAPILDDQWLAWALETGIAGVLALAWLLARSARRLARAARATTGPDGWLFAGLAAAIAGFAVGMMTYDAFSFTQVTVLLFVLLGAGAAALRVIGAPQRPASAAAAGGAAPGAPPARDGARGGPGRPPDSR